MERYFSISHWGMFCLCDQDPWDAYCDIQNDIMRLYIKQ
jgi:hypothetical protein